MGSTVVLITGANTGIGFQIARALAKDDLQPENTAYDVLVGGRVLSKAQEATASIEKEFPSSRSKFFPFQIDIEDDESIARAFNEAQTNFGKVDTLVNNAGAFFDREAQNGNLTEREMWNKSWNVNTTSTYLMTKAFVPLLLESSDPCLLFVTSGTSSLATANDHSMRVNVFPPKGWPKPSYPSAAAYRSSKTGMNMVFKEWERILMEDSVKVWAIAPGFLATNLAGDPDLVKKMGAGNPEVAGPFIRSIIEGKRDDDVGKVINKDGIQPW